MRNKLRIALWIFTFVPLLVYGIIYNLMGSTIPVSWNEFGEVTEHVTKSIAVFMIPTIVVSVSFMMYFLGQLLNKKKILNISFDLFSLFVVLVLNFVALFPLYLIFFDGGNTYNFLSIVLLIIAIFVLIVGFIFPQFKYEGKYGFITPWTKASGTVFYKTQQVASGAFSIGALVLGTITLFINKYTLIALLAYTLIMLVLILIPLMYSKTAYEKED